MPILIAIPFFLWLIRYVNLDFYYDEMYSLVNYVLVPVKSTMFVYLDSNNHFLSNVINNLYLRMLGINNLYVLLEHPWIMRMPQLFYAVATLFVFYKLNKKFFGRYGAMLALLFLATSISYYNHAVLVRGYSLSVLLVCMFLYTLWSYEKLQQSLVKSYFPILIMISGAALIYMMPSNVYFIGAVVLFYFYKSTFDDTIDRKHLVYLRLFILGGIIIASLLYLPLIVGMFEDPHLASHPFPYWRSLAFLPSVMYSFLNWRFDALALAACGLIFFRKRFPHRDKTLFCCFALTLPFVFSFLRGDHLYDRHFVHLIPVFCILLSLGIQGLFCIIKDWAKKPLLIWLFISTNVVFFLGIRHINGRLDYYIENTAVKKSSLLYNYWQHNYRPRRLLDFFVKQECDFVGSISIGECDRAAMPRYFEMYLASIDNAGGRRILISIAPSHVERYFSIHPLLKCERLNEELQFHNLYEVTER